MFAHVTPSYGSSGKVVGYHSNRRVPNRQIVNTHIIPIYQDLLRTEKAASSPKDGMDAAVRKVGDLLAEARMGYNEFIFSLGV